MDLSRRKVLGFLLINMGFHKLYSVMQNIHHSSGIPFIDSKTPGKSAAIILC
jgi:hypothetical protein